MVSAPEYSVQTQAKLVHALCLLHNFVRVHDPDDFDEVDHELTARVVPSTAADAASMFGGDITPLERQEAAERRDRIAKEMWESYMAYIDSNN